MPEEFKPEIETTSEEAKKIEAETKARDEKMAALYDDLMAVADKYDMPNAVFIGMSKTEDKKPYIFIKGTELMAARLASMYARHVKDKINQMLSS